MNHTPSLEIFMYCLGFISLSLKTHTENKAPPKQAINQPIIPTLTIHYNQEQHCLHSKQATNPRNYAGYLAAD